MQLPYERLTPPKPTVFDDWMAYFYLYADESGKLGNSEYTSLCGYLTHLAEWERITQEWNNLRLAWDVPTLHMRPILFPDDNPEWSQVKVRWGKGWVQRRDMMLAEFAGLIERSHAVCIGSVVDSGNFASRPTKFTEHWPNPLYMSFHHIIMTALDKIDRLSDEHHLSVVLDEDREYAMRCYDVLDALRITFPRVKKRIDSISFGNDKAFPSLQMADMIAYESRRLMQERKANPDAPPSNLYTSLTRIGLHQPHFYNPEALDKLAALQEASSENAESSKLLP